MARLVKAVNFWLYRAVLPPEVSPGEGLVLCHRGLGVVVRPNTAIGDGVHIAHGVTIGSLDDIGVGPSVVKEDRVTIGAGAIVLARRVNRFGWGISPGLVPARSWFRMCLVVRLP